MTIRSKMLLGVVAVTAGTAAFGQGRGGAAFTATGTSCSDVTWSEEALQQYPRIASACREVVQRDGRYYVRFEGEVRRVADRGRQLTIDFQDGDLLTLEPPENFTLTLNGRRTRVQDLRPGDELTFFVPQNQLAASFFAGQPDTSEPQIVPITPEREIVAQNQTSGSTLPRTAGLLPLAGGGGLLFLLLGAVLTVWRRGGAA